MAIFNPLRIFKSNKSNDDYTYVNYEDYSKDNQVKKSFRNTKSAIKSSVDSLEIGSESDSHRGELATRDDIIRRKSILKQYSGSILVQAIIRNRINQVSKYTVPARQSLDNIGYEITPKNNQDKKLSKKELNRCIELENIIYQTGKVYKPWRDTFPQFVTKLIFDHYTYDQINIERSFEQARSNILNHFNIVDAGTVLINKYPDSADKPREFVQWIDGKPLNYYSEKELTFITYWSQTDIHSKGYGFSPVEASMTHIANHINTEQFNSRFFSQGGMVRGLLVINADGDDQDSAAALESIRRSWMPLQGLNGAWKIPMITAQDAKFVNMTQNSKDMEFTEWLNYLIKMICADFNTQTEEINVPNKGGATGSNAGSTLNEGNTVKNKLQQSKNNGLIPLLKFIERIVNDQILRYYDSDYKFRFILGDPADDSSFIENIQAKQKAGMTLNEGRDLMHLPPLKDGDTPGDATAYVQLKTIEAKMNASQNVAMQHKNDYKPDSNLTSSNIDSTDNSNNDDK